METDKYIPIAKIRLNLSISANNNVSNTIFSYNMLSPPETTRKPALDSNPSSPYYTNHVRYPSKLQSEPWQDTYAFFFNRDVFKTRVYAFATADPAAYIPDSKVQVQEWLKDTEQNNIMIMLRCLFRISEQSGQALSDSYHSDILNETNPRVLSDINPVDSVFAFMRDFGYSSEPTKRDFFMKVGGSEKMAIAEVKWLNDIASHPVYSEFIKSYNEAIQSIKKSSSSREVDQYNESIQKLNKTLNDRTTVNALIDQLKTPYKTSEQIKNILNNLKLKTDYEAAKLIVEIQDLISAQERSIYQSTSSDSEDSKYDKVFLPKGKTSFKNDLYIPAIKVFAGNVVMNFIENHTIMYLSDKQRDGSPEKKSIIDRNTHIEKFFKAIFNYNNKLINTLNDVSLPKRKTSNAKLYKLIDDIKFSNPINESDRNVLNVVYNKYVSSYIKGGILPPENNIYMYSGVDEINPEKKDDNPDNKNDESNQSYEICVLVNLVKPDTLIKQCEYRDVRMAEEFRSLIDAVRHGPNNSDYYRKQEPDKSSAASTDTNANEPKKTNGGQRRKTPRLRSIGNKTRKTYNPNR